MSKPPPDPLFVFHEGMESVFCLLFHFTEIDEIVYAGTGCGSVHVWDLKDNRKVTTHKIGTSTCLSLHYADDGLYVTQEKAGPSVVWKEECTTKHWEKHKVFLSSYIGFCRSILLQYDTLVLPCSESTLKVIPLWDDTHKEKLIQCDNNEKPGEIMALKTFKNYLLTLYESGLMKLFCLDSFICLTSSNMLDQNKDGGADCPMAFDFDAILGRGIMGSSSANLIEFSVELSNKDYRLVKNRSVSMTNPGASCVRIRSDGKLVAVGCWDGRIRLYSMKTLKLLVVLDNHRRKTVHDLVFASQSVTNTSRDSVFASGGLDGRLCLWSLY